MSEADLIDATRLVRIVRREKALILAVFLNVLMLAVIYISFAPVLYTAKASILLDKTVSTAVSEIATLRRLGFETESILSEIETIKSDQVLKKVIEDLGKSEIEKVQEFARREDVREVLVDNISVSRINETYVMEVMFRNSDPDVAGVIANAFARAYIEDQLDLKSDMSLRTANWLKEKLSEINAQIIDKNRNLIDYRVRYNQHQSRNLANGKIDSAWTLKELDRLETETKAYEELYQSYLEKLKSISVQDNFPVTETRVINAAVPPKDKSQPKTNLALAAGAVIGLGLGIFIAIIKDVRDVTIKRAGQVVRELGGNVIGFLPPSAGKTKVKTESPYVLEASLGKSSFSAEQVECFRAILNKESRSVGGYVIGIVSDISPTCSARFVEAFSSFCSLGMNVTTIDGYFNFSDKGKTSDCLMNRSAWFVNREAYEAAKRKTEEFDGILIKAGSAVSDLCVPHYNKRNINTAIGWARDESSLVMVNCPSLNNKSEFECYADAVDGFVILLRWSVSRINEVKFLLSSVGIERNKILGFVLVDVDLGKMQRHYGHRPLDTKLTTG